MVPVIVHSVSNDTVFILMCKIILTQTSEINTISLTSRDG